MTTLSESEVLNQAADLIEAHGLWKGRFVPPGHQPDEIECPHCTFGAIRALTRDDESLRIRAAGVMATTIDASWASRRRHPTGAIFAIADWNDLPTTTQSDAVVRLREAARSARM